MGMATELGLNKNEKILNIEIYVLNFWSATVGTQTNIFDVQSVLYISANIYCRTRNLPNTDVSNYSIFLRLFLKATSSILRLFHSCDGKCLRHCSQG